MDRGAWWAAVHEVAESQTRLRDYGNDNSVMLLAGMTKLCHEQMKRGYEAPSSSLRDVHSTPPHGRVRTSLPQSSSLCVPSLRVLCLGS